jgi:hypothetical protein
MSCNKADKEVPLYEKPYKGKPRFFTEGLLDKESITTSNLQIIDRNSKLSSFHRDPFPPAPQYLSSPSTIAKSISPLSLPSTIESADTKMPSSELEMAKQKVMKQCQYFICYVVYELLFSQDTMNKGQKKQLMYDSYHGVAGKPHLLHHAWLFTQGITPGNKKFAAIMEQSIVDGSTILRKEATQEDHTFIVNEVPVDGDNSKVITLALLKCKSINSKEAFSAHSIQVYATDALKYCKIATAFGMQLLQKDGTLPSGWNRQDFFDKVLDHMYNEIQNEPDAKNQKWK